jgi:hypothetical protein
MSIPVLFGLMGFVVDLGWAYWRREAAKTAAQSAASAVAASAGSTAPTAQANTNCPATLDSSKPWNVGCQFAIQNGFTNGANRQTVQIQIGSGSTGIPVTGVAPTKYWVTATVSESIPSLFAIFSGTNGLQVTAQATTAVYNGGASGCVYILNKNTDGSSNNTAFTVTGGVGTTHCGYYVNGTNSASFNMTGGGIDLGSSGAKVNLQAASTANWPPSGGSILPAPTTNNVTWAQGTWPVSNPFTGATVPTPGTCLADPNITSGTVSIPAGTYCSGITIKGGSVTFQSGTYIIGDGTAAHAGASIQIKGGSPFVDATAGVTLYFAANAGTLKVTGNGLNLNAPTGGPYDGIAVWKPAYSSGTSENVSWTGGNININGVIDMPDANLTYTGGTTQVNQSMIVDTFTLTGGNIGGPATSKYLTGVGTGSSSGGTYMVE